MPRGLQGVERLRQEEIVERQPHAAIIEPHVGKRRVADDGVDATVGELGVAEVLDADVMAGVEGLGDSSRDAVELDADEPHAFGCPGQEIAAAAPGLEDRRVPRHAQAEEGLVHRGNDGLRGVEGVERGASGTRVLFGGEEGDELLAQGLPGGALVAFGDRVGEEREGDRPEAPESGKRPPFGLGRPSLLTLDRCERADGFQDILGLGLLARGRGGLGPGPVFSDLGDRSPVDCRFRRRTRGDRRGRSDGRRGFGHMRHRVLRHLGAWRGIEERKERLRGIEPGPSRLDPCLVQLIPTSGERGHASVGGFSGEGACRPLGPARIELEFRLRRPVGANQAFAVFDDSVGDPAVGSLTRCLGEGCRSQRVGRLEEELLFLGGRL